MAFSRTAPFSPFATQGFGPEMVYRCNGKPLFSQNPLAIQTFGREKVCRDKKNSSMHENPFTTQGFLPKRVYRCKGKPLFRKTRSRYRLLDGKWRVAARKTVQCTKTRSRHRVLGRKWCVVAWGNSSIGENLFATGQWGAG